ncbi:MAG TPA: acetamidase/formamidase family protein [Candidatus Dormibacteraeota bacterium]|nr:acetamidase/formamidase family protein [Candidatus Dormibacteraeota bacterium]
MKTIRRTDPKYALDSRHEAVARISVGESFVVETHDCRTGTITSPDQVGELLDTRFVNPATGPISIEGVTAGNTICVEIEELHVDSRRGLMVTRPGVTSLAITGEPQLRIVTCDDAYADVGSFRVPVTPMIGVLGVAPAGDPVSTFRGGEHGGNMDTLLVGAGSRVFLPTFLDGGMLYFGDVHAAMGDGEVFLSGIEVAGRIQARVTVAPGWSLPTPLVETAEIVAVVAGGATFDEAAKAALAKAVEVLVAGRMNPIDAGFLMSAAGHLRVCQYIPLAGLVHCRFELPKSVLSLNQIKLPSLGAAI